MAGSIHPLIDAIAQAGRIAGAIRDWRPDWPQGDACSEVGLLYQQTLWVYLLRRLLTLNFLDRLHAPRGQVALDYTGSLCYAPIGNPVDGRPVTDLPAAQA